MLSSKKGMSSLKFNSCGFGSYETAHSMCHKIRAGLIAPEQNLAALWKWMKRGLAARQEPSLE